MAVTVGKDVDEYLATHHVADLAMLVTACDVDSMRLANMKAVAERRYQRKMDHLRLEMDYRKALDDRRRLYSCFERPQFAVAPVIRAIREKGAT